MISLTLNSILKALNAHKLDAKLQTATQQIYFIHKANNLDFPIFFKIDEKSCNLQILLFFPTSMRPKAPPEVARLLHLLNKEIDLPGFGMDEHSNVIFYRCVLLMPKNEIDENLLFNVLSSVCNVGPTFYPIVATVANGAFFEAVAADARNILQQAIK